MSGHSKWKTIKRKKAITDGKRGKLFTKLIREITMAARTGGGSPDSNPRLRVAVDKAREESMPSDNIKRAIARATGEGADAVHYEEAVYEGYGPGGTAIMIEALTDNKNRTSSELRAQIARTGGNLGEPGCVAWNFQPAGVITFARARHEEEALMAAALEAGAEDFRVGESSYDVITAPTELDKVRSALKAKGLEPASAELARLPKTTVTLEGHAAEQMMKLLEVLEDHDDVQHVYANYDISDKVMEQLVASAA